MLVGPTFFAHFCAGDSVTALQPTVEYFRRHGIGGILDYAAEADVDEGIEEGSLPNQPARVFP